MNRGEWYTLQDGKKARILRIDETGDLRIVSYEVYEMKYFEGDMFPRPARLYETADNADYFEDTAEPWDGPVAQ